MRIPNGIIFIWTGTNATIPAGWSRDTSMDDTYPKGTANATNPNVTGGATTHSHTSPSHTHGLGTNHTHTITLAAASGTAQGTGNSSNAAQIGHNHSAVTSGALQSGSVSSVAATYGAFANDPPYAKVIYVTPTTFVTFLPTGIITLADAAAPSGMKICDGTSGTPNLVDKYLKGAPAGADADTSTVMGTLTDIHPLSHTHTTSHTHGSTVTGNPTSLTAQLQSGSAVTMGNHTHTVTPDAATPSTVNNVTLTTTETVEPAYTKLLALQVSASMPVPKSIIGMWKGLLSAIPAGWILCDGNGGTIDMRDRHLKITGTVGAVGATGGSNTHVHAAQTHNHVISHSHTVPAVGHAATSDTVGSSPNSATKVGATHTVSTNAQNLTLDNASTTADSANNEPVFRTVAFIKLAYRVNTGGILLNYL